MRKYEFKRGENILDTHLVYICEGGYSGKHRLVVAKCDLCNSIGIHRLDTITNGKKKSCGCLHKQMIEDGTLASVSVKIRNEKPFLQKGGWNWQDGYAIILKKRVIDSLDVEDIVRSIVKYIKEHKERS